MNADSMVILCGIVCMIFWSCGYVLLGIVTSQMSSVFQNQQLNQFTIDSLYGGTMCVVNLIIAIVTNRVDNFFLLSEKSIALPLFGYIALFVLSAFVYLFGYNLLPQSTLSPAVYVSISSTYPLGVFLISYFALHQRNINLHLTIPGIVLIIVGITLLSCSKQ